MKFSQKMTLYFFYIMVQKSQKWLKTQIKGVLKGAWSDRDTNGIFAHCSLIFYFLDFKFSNFVCPSELHPLIMFFLKNSFRKKENIRKTSQNALAPSIFIVWSIVLKLVHRFYTSKRRIRCYKIFNFTLEVEIWTKNLQKRCFTLPGRLWRSITFFVGRN